jgi:hypothetical protein
MARALRQYVPHHVISSFHLPNRTFSSGGVHSSIPTILCDNFEDERSQDLVRTKFVFESIFRSAIRIPQSTFIVHWSSFRIWDLRGTVPQ